MLTVYADGVAYLTESNGNPNVGKLVAGAGSNVGVWGAKARRKFIARSAYLGNAHGKKCRTFILTYRKGNVPNAKDSKKHINTFLQSLRRANLQGYAYTAELGDDAGLLHYHFLAAMDYRTPQQVNDAWARIRGDESKNAVRAYRALKDIHGAAGYAAKAANYASKCAELVENGTFPKDMRVWATSNNLVGKEKITITDNGIIAAYLASAKSRKVMHLESGIEVVSYWFDRDTTRDLYANQEYLHRLSREKSEKTAKKARKCVSRETMLIFDS